MDGDVALNATQVCSDMLWTIITSNHLASIVFVRLYPALACCTLRCGALELEQTVGERQRGCIRTFRSCLVSSASRRHMFPSFCVFHDGSWLWEDATLVSSCDGASKILKLQSTNMRLNLPPNVVGPASQQLSHGPDDHKQHTCRIASE